MAKKGNSPEEKLVFKKISKANDKSAYYAKLGYLTKWIFAPNKYDIAPLLEDKKEFDEKLRYRIYNNFLAQPKIIWYLNKYLNSIYQFKTHDPECLLRTVADIARIYGLRNSDNLYFSKYQVFKRDSFSQLLEKYSKESGIIFSGQEIQCLYRLYEIGIIRDEDREALEQIIDGEEKPKNRSNNYNIPVNEVKINLDKSPEIVKFSNIILGVKTKRGPCKNCALAYKPSAVLDTNITDFSQTPVDIAIVANETAMEADIATQTPLSGEDGKLFRGLFYNLVEKHKLKYVITNSALCYPEGKELNISQLKKIMGDCKGIIDEIHLHFKPKLIILMGNNVKSNYGIREKISEINGRIIANKYFCMTSPAEALKSKLAMDRFQKAIYALDLHLAKATTEIQTIPDSSFEDFSVTDEAVSNITARIEKGDTLFNIETLEDKIIIILITSSGKKKYIVEPIQYPIYIRYGQYKDCEYISDKVDAKVILNSRQKQMLTNRLNQHIKSIVEC